MSRNAKRLLIGIPALFVLSQLVPYGRHHTNPPVVQEPKWDSPETRALVQSACFDCHSNETRWPAYSSIAPSSWLVEYDVDTGRRHLNFSEWHREQRHAKDAAEQVQGGDMPPTYYGWMHAQARLSAADRDRLVRSFETMFGKAPREAGR
jgi:hypothetical protein